MEPKQNKKPTSAEISASRIEAFFNVADRPTREQCDKHALAITGQIHCEAAPAQGCQSYTLICYGKPRIMAAVVVDQAKSSVVQFRLAESQLDMENMATARIIHGDIVPETQLADPLGNLLVYISERKPGLTPRQLAPTTPNMNKVKQTLMENFMQELALYFKSCWVAKIDRKHKLERDTRVVQTWDRMQLIRECETGLFVGKHINLVEENMAYVHDPIHGQTLMHGDLNLTNFLVNPTTFKISGLVDWASARYEQFGYELYIVQMATGYNVALEEGGFKFYNNHKHLKRVFWDTFFRLLNIGSIAEARLFMEQLRPAWRLGLILREAFVHSADGQITDEVVLPLPENGVQLFQLQAMLNDEEDFFELLYNEDYQREQEKEEHKLLKQLQEEGAETTDAL
ncbi:hypothetical protein IWX49DRAFT_621381 [Phyllosticta citricarpa]|uniref:Aminoglycoside phosphotransferase domain-containing protein n=2 Tax=Phyllosticta TaxID=121621 RepID=A0ABR1LKH2_9PEZI